MVKLNSFNETFDSANLEQNQDQSQFQSFGSQEQTNSQTKQASGLMDIVGECLTYAPLLYERFSGKKLPMMTGTMGDIQAILQQLATEQKTLTQGLQAVINNQQLIWQEINQLKTNANTGFVNLDKRIDSFANIRLTHERERKQVDYNTRINPTTLIKEDNYE